MLHPKPELRAVAVRGMLLLDWKVTSMLPVSCTQISGPWHEHPTLGDEAPLLFWDGATMWRTSEWEPCELSELMFTEDAA
jgi:hypothetical protein